MNIRSSRLAVWALVASSLFGAPLLAQTPVTDVALNTQFGLYASAFTTFATDQAATNKILTEYTLYMEGGGTGNGVIELLMAQNNEIAKLQAFNDQYFANKSQQERGDRASMMAAQDQMARRGAMAAMAGQDTLGCDVVTHGMISGGAHANSRDVDTAQRRDVELRMTNNRNLKANLADLVATRSTFCSALDVQNSRPGCSQAGALPNADIDSKSLSLGAINKAAPVPTNRTFTPDQEAAAEAYIRNVLPLPAPQPQGNARNTVEGKLAYIEYLRYNARWAPIDEALSSIQAMNSPMKNTPEGWNDSEHQSAYGANGTIFPGMKYPAKPSEREVLYYQVYKEYQDPKTIADRESADEVTLLREQIALSALNARLQLLAIERQEEQNKLLAAMLAGQIDPVTLQTVAAKIPAGTLDAGKNQ